MRKINNDINDAEDNEVSSPEIIEHESEKKDNSHFASTYSLKPNEQYEVNHYSYETDRYGRIKRCEGTLRLEDGKRNTDHQAKAGGEYWTIVNKKDTIFKYIFWERLDYLPIPECCFHFIWCQIA